MRRRRRMAAPRCLGKVSATSPPTAPPPLLVSRGASLKRRMIYMGFCVLLFLFIFVMVENLFEVCVLFEISVDHIFM
jgi:hypothetical protein